MTTVKMQSTSKVLYRTNILYPQPIESAQLIPSILVINTKTSFTHLEAFESSALSIFSRYWITNSLWRSTLIVVDVLIDLFRN